MSDWNTAIIEEFRQNGGKVGGMFEGAPLLLLHHRGRRTGAARVSPLMYRRVGDAYAIFASKAGAPRHPDWYHNLTERPDTVIEIGDKRVPVRARVVAGAERTKIWEHQKSEWPQFAEYERATDRQIPVVLLEPSENER